MVKELVIYFLVGLFAFANGLSGAFMLDDHSFFTMEIKDIRFMPKHFIPMAYKTHESSGVPHGQPNFYYRPFAKVLPSISYVMFAERTFFYHLFNLILLVTAGFLLFRFLLVTGVMGHRGAFLAGLFYIIHPINGVMVNYITASVFTAQVIFMLGALYCLTLGYEGRGTRDEGRKEKDIKSPSSVFGLQSLVPIFSSIVYRPSSIGLSLFFFVLALMCHETALLLPVYASIFLYIYGPAGTFLERAKVCIRKTWFLWAAAAGWLVLRFFYASLGDSLFAKFSRFEMGPFEYAASVGKLTCWYLSKLVIPWDIVLIWATPVVRGAEVWIWNLAMVLMVCFVFYLFKRSQDKIVRLGVLWLAAGFLPLPLMCLFQPTHGPMIEPHWFVFSSIGSFVIFARTATTPGVEAVASINKRVVVVVCLMMVPWFIMGWRHNHLWSDEKRYAHYWCDVSPSIKAVWFHLGEMYFKERRFSEAAGYYERSIRRTYQDYLAYQRMGLAYFSVQDYRRAQLNFMLSLELEPRQPGIRERLKWIEKHTE